MYVKIVGSVKAFQGQRNLTAYIIRRVEDHNEITFHMLDATAQHLEATRGPPSVQLHDIFCFFQLLQKSMLIKWYTAKSIPELIGRWQLRPEFAALDGSDGEPSTSTAFARRSPESTSHRHDPPDGSIRKVSSAVLCQTTTLRARCSPRTRN